MLFRLCDTIKDIVTSIIATSIILGLESVSNLSSQCSFFSSLSLLPPLLFLIFLAEFYMYSHWIAHKKEMTLFFQFPIGFI